MEAHSVTTSAGGEFCSSANLHIKNVGRHAKFIGWYWPDSEQLLFPIYDQVVTNALTAIFNHTYRKRIKYVYFKKHPMVKFVENGIEFLVHKDSAKDLIYTINCVLKERKNWIVKNHDLRQLVRQANSEEYIRVLAR